MAPQQRAVPLPIYIASALIDLEAALRTAGLWQRQRPPAEALASQQPFCVDTLELPQWLQFVFIPRMRMLLESNQSLPDNCAIAPMVEEFGRDRDLSLDELAAVLARIDAALTRGRV